VRDFGFYLTVKNVVNAHLDFGFHKSILNLTHGSRTAVGESVDKPKEAASDLNVQTAVIIIGF
jgi:hypothetical protein